MGVGAGEPWGSCLEYRQGQVGSQGVWWQVGGGGRMRVKDEQSLQERKEPRGRIHKANHGAGWGRAR